MARCSVARLVQEPQTRLVPNANARLSSRWFRAFASETKRAFGSEVGTKTGDKRGLAARDSLLASENKHSLEANGNIHACAPTSLNPTRSDQPKSNLEIPLEVWREFAAPHRCLRPLIWAAVFFHIPLLPSRAVPHLQGFVVAFRRRQVTCQRAAWVSASRVLTEFAHPR